MNQQNILASIMDGKFRKSFPSEFEVAPRKGADVFPDFSKENWQRLGGLRVPKYIPIREGYNYLMTLERYSVLMACLLADGSIDAKGGNFCISYGIKSAARYEYIEFIIDILAPFITSVEPYIKKEVMSDGEVSICYTLRISLVAAFKPWRELFYSPVVSRDPQSKVINYQKRVPPDFQEIFTNNLMLSVWIQDDGTRETNVESPASVGPGHNETALCIGISPDTAIFQKVLKENFGLETSVKDLNSQYNKKVRTKGFENARKQRKLIINQRSLSSETITTNNQTRLYLLTRPFLTPCMTRKVLSPAFFFGRNKLEFNLLGLAFNENNQLIRKFKYERLSLKYFNYCYDYLFFLKPFYLENEELPLSNQELDDLYQQQVVSKLRLIDAGGQKTISEKAWYRTFPKSENKYKDLSFFPPETPKS